MEILDPDSNVLQSAFGDGGYVEVVRSGSTYYLIAATDPNLFPDETIIYDVTNPASPVLVRTLPGILAYGSMSEAGTSFITKGCPAGPAWAFPPAQPR